VTRRQEDLGIGVSCNGKTPNSKSEGFPGVDGGVAFGEGASLNLGGDIRNFDAIPFSLAASSKKFNGVKIN